MKIKTVCIFCVYLSLCASLFAQDHIIFRDGREQDCKVIQVNSDKTLCKENDKRKAKEIILDNSGIYMIRYEKRGNVFFTKDGERFSGPTVEKPDNKATIVYLKEGKEIEAFNFEMSSTAIKFKEEKGRGGFIIKRDKDVETTEIPKSEVFMLKYPDGTKDILTPFVTKKTEDEKVETDTGSESLPGQTQNANDGSDLENSGVKNDINIADQREEETKLPELVEVHITLPCKATIQTVQNSDISAIVLQDDGEDIAYKRQSNPNGPTYHIKHANIKDLQYEKQSEPEKVQSRVTSEEKKEQTRSYPCKAIIKTKQGVNIRAIIQSDNGITITYKRQTNPKGPKYTIKHSGIKEISY